jgi:hypothetical protein
MALVGQDIEKETTKDFGAFENQSLCCLGNTEVEAMTGLQHYVPYCIYKSHPITTESQINEMIKALSLQKIVETRPRGGFSLEVGKPRYVLKMFQLCPSGILVSR